MFPSHTSDVLKEPRPDPFPITLYAVGFRIGLPIHILEQRCEACHMGQHPKRFKYAALIQIILRHCIKPDKFLDDKVPASDYDWRRQQLGTFSDRGASLFDSQREN